MKPIIYIISTPIGNMEDITIRAERILREEAELILCEDTRQTGKLLEKFGIKKKLISLHAHTTEKKIENILDMILAKKAAAYMTDCGTPAVSDPGSVLVCEARKRGIDIIPIPGPSAVTAAFSICGFHGKNMIFSGFLSKKPGKRINELLKLKEFNGTIIIYESPHRIKKTISAISEVFPGQNVFIAREMTKTHEEFISYNTNDTETIIQTLTEKGEFTLAIDNN